MSNIKIYISFDFEGLGGISQRDDVTSDNKDYKQKYAVAQLNALFEQLRDHEVVISDSHDKGNNIPWEITNDYPNVKLISGGIRKYYMMSGIDESLIG